MLHDDRSGLRGLLALAAAAVLWAGCPGGDDDDAGDDDDDVSPVGLTVRGVVHDLEDFSVPAAELTVVVADPAPMLVAGETPTVLGAGAPAADGSFEITGIDASEAAQGLIMIVDDSGEGYVSAATGIDLAEYDGYLDGDVVDEQIAFAVTAATVDRLEADLTAAGWGGGDLFGDGALLGFVQQYDLTPIGGATISTALGDPDVYYADEATFGGGAFDDGSGAPNVETSVAGEALWVVPDALVAPWSCAADGHSFDNLLVGSTEEILVIVAFRPAAG